MLPDTVTAAAAETDAAVNAPVVADADRNRPLTLAVLATSAPLTVAVVARLADGPRRWPSHLRGQYQAVPPVLHLRQDRRRRSEQSQCSDPVCSGATVVGRGVHLPLNGVKEVVPSIKLPVRPCYRLR